MRKNFISPSAGTYKFTAKATDNLGAETISSTIKVMVTNTAIASSKPAPSSSHGHSSETASVVLAPNPVSNLKRTSQKPDIKQASNYLGNFSLRNRDNKDVLKQPESNYLT